MPTDKRYSGASPTPVEPPAAVGAWAPSGASTPGAAANIPRMAGGASADESGGVPSAVRLPPAPRREPDQQILAALAVITARLDGLAGESARSSELAHAAFERLDRFESASRGASAHPSESDGDSDGSSDRATSPGARDYGTEYLVVDHLQNRHWKAREQAEQAEQHPRRYSLYGNETYDLLQQGKHKGGGTLGLALEYCEPACLYGQTALNGVRDCADRAADLDPELARSLDACANTIAGVYGLVNTLRTLIVERAHVTAPSATAGDKKRQQWVESQLHEADLGRYDVAPQVRKLKAQYDYEAGKQDLRSLASAGRAARSGGRRGRDDGPPAKPRSARRRERERVKGDEPPAREKPRAGSLRTEVALSTKLPATKPSSGKRGSDAESAGDAPKPRKGAVSKADRERGGGKQPAREGGGGRATRRDDGRRGGGSLRRGRGARSDGDGGDADDSDSSSSAY